MFKKFLCLSLIVFALSTASCSSMGGSEEAESTTLRSMAEKGPATSGEEVAAKTVYSTTIPLDTVEYIAPFDENQGGGVPPHVLVDESSIIWQSIDDGGRWPIDVEHESAEGGIVLQNGTFVPYIPDNEVDGEALVSVSDSKPKVEPFVGDDGIEYDIWTEMEKCAGLLTFYKDGIWTGPVCN